jgi:hexulose-6-phosphate isomerase
MSLDRREFLGAMAATAGITSLAAAGRSVLNARADNTADNTAEDPPATSPRTLKKAVMVGMVGEGETLLDKFKILRDCGFAGVELDSPGDLKTEEVLAAQEKSGLKVHGVVDSVHWKAHLNSASADARAQGVAGLKQAITDAAAWGASSVLLVPAVVNEKQPYDQAWKLATDGIKACLEVAAEKKVIIAVENVWNGFLLSPLEAARFVDQFESPWVRFHFDIGNVINFGFPEQWIDILGKRIVKLHIKDFSRKKRDDEGLWKGFGVELGSGDAGWQRVMKALDACGYSTAAGGNWATAEVRGGDAARLKQISKQMDDLFKM